MKKLLLILVLVLMYKSNSAQIVPDSICQILYPPSWEIKRVLYANAPTTDTTCLGVFIQTDYHILNAFGGDTAAVSSWVRAEFAANNFKIYQQDGALLYIDSIGFTSDTTLFNYPNSSYNILDFSKFCDSIKPTADLFQVWSFSAYNLGGIAYVGVLGSSHYYRTSYCNVYQSYSLYPVFSWTPYVTTHELGHNIGLQHTQWCGWTLANGTTGAIDGCYTTEGGCAQPPLPPAGTIMSYCHLTSVGIDFLLGFGSIPKKVLRDNLYNYKKSGQCKNPNYYFTPSSIVVTNKTTSGATISWTSRRVDFIVAYRIKGTTTWTTISVPASHFYTFTSLNSNTIYQFKIKAVNSPYSKVYQFKTN